MTLVMGVGDERRAHAGELDELGRLAAHDLREPLRMVGSYLELLESRYSDRLDDDGREFLGHAVEGVERMERLIRDLLAYARIEAAAEDEALATADTNVALEEALANLRVVIEEAGADVSAAELPDVRARDTQLVQLFQNLIANAIKFHAEAPRVSVGATRVGRDVEFTVSDNGIGIDPDQAERIFEPFKRLVSADEYPGTGIGLAICRRIVDGHGGQIWVESEPGRGATFHFTLQGGD